MTTSTHPLSIEDLKAILIAQFPPGNERELALAVAECAYHCGRVDGLDASKRVTKKVFESYTGG